MTSNNLQELPPPENIEIIQSDTNTIKFESSNWENHKSRVIQLKKYANSCRIFKT